MFCPQCEEEFSWDVMVCPVCDVDTVDRLPGPEPTPDAELVNVLVTGDTALIAVAQSMLDGEKIDYFVRGDGLQGMLGLGQISSGFGGAEFWVRAEDAENARALLEGLTAPSQKPDSEP